MIPRVSLETMMMGILKRTAEDRFKVLCEDAHGASEGRRDRLRLE